jgi:hypothetical protein
VRGLRPHADEAHHIRFAPSRSLNRNVSDEYAVPASAGFTAAIFTITAMRPHGGLGLTLTRCPSHGGMPSAPESKNNDLDKQLLPGIGRREAHGKQGGLNGAQHDRQDEQKSQPADAPP